MQEENKRRIVQLFLEKYVGEVEDLEYYQKETEKLAEDLFSTKEKVGVLTPKRTEVLRKMFGVYDAGIWQDAKSIARSFGITYQSACQMVLTLGEDIRFMVYTIPSRKKRPLTKMSSIFSKEDQEKARDMTIWDIGLNTRTIQALRREDVITLLDLSCYGIGDFRLGEVGRYKILSEFHQLGFSFMEELSLEERRNIIESSFKEVVDQSSVCWFMNQEDIYWYHAIRSFKTIANLRKERMNGYCVPIKFEEIATAIGVSLELPKSEFYGMRKEELLRKYQSLTLELAALKEQEGELSQKIEEVLKALETPTLGESL